MIAKWIPRSTTPLIDRLAREALAKNTAEGLTEVEFFESLNRTGAWAEARKAEFAARMAA